MQAACSLGLGDPLLADGLPSTASPPLLPLVNTPCPPGLGDALLASKPVVAAGASLSPSWWDDRSEGQPEVFLIKPSRVGEGVGDLVLDSTAERRKQGSALSVGLGDLLRPGRPKCAEGASPGPLDNAICLGLGDPRLAAIADRATLPSSGSGCPLEPEDCASATLSWAVVAPDRAPGLFNRLPNTPVFLGAMSLADSVRL